MGIDRTEEAIERQPPEKSGVYKKLSEYLHRCPSRHRQNIRLHRESGVLQEAGFRKLGLAPCSRLPAFFRAKPQHPRLRIWKQEAGSRRHLNF